MYMGFIKVPNTGKMRVPYGYTLNLNGDTNTISSLDSKVGTMHLVCVCFVMAYIYM